MITRYSYNFLKYFKSTNRCIYIFIIVFIFSFSFAEGASGTKSAHNKEQLIEAFLAVTKGDITKTLEVGGLIRSIDNAKGIIISVDGVDLGIAQYLFVKGPLAKLVGKNVSDDSIEHLGAFLECISLIDEAKLSLIANNTDDLNRFAEKAYKALDTRGEVIGSERLSMTFGDRKKEAATIAALVNRSTETKSVVSSFGDSQRYNIEDLLDDLIEIRDVENFSYSYGKNSKGGRGSRRQGILNAVRTTNINSQRGNLYELIVAVYFKLYKPIPGYEVISVRSPLGRSDVDVVLRNTSGDTIHVQAKLSDYFYNADTFGGRATNKGDKFYLWLEKASNSNSGDPLVMLESKKVYYAMPPSSNPIWESEQLLETMFKKVPVAKMRNILGLPESGAFARKYSGLDDNQKILFQNEFRRVIEPVMIEIDIPF